MDLITTHINADFDCLGAMVGARKLYPDALMVFSGSQEKSMRDFFLKSTGYVLNFTRAKDVDLSSVTRLILVDCQHASRIGRFAELVGRPGVEIHIYDHHPDAAGSLTATGGLVRECGSSTTIITTLLRERCIDVNSTEATLMMLGIYEDTGSLTFPSTTVDDYLAAAWLLEHGAHLNTVADFITQELTAEQISLLNDLLKSIAITTINGTDVAIASASLDHYVGDIAVLAHMMRDMENLEALFITVAMGTRIYVVARSRIPEVDVGEVLRALGGGGHATAASATIRNLTLIQALARLEEVLRQKVNPRRLARDIMSAPVITIPASATISEARETLTRYNVNAMPAVAEGEMVGIVSRRIVEQALYHGLGAVPVSEYMHTEFMRVAPETSIAEIQDYMLSRNRRFVPVFEGKQVVGVVTRTDLLRFMYSGEALYDLARESLPVKSREVAGLLRKQMNSAALQLLHDLGSVGAELGLEVYAVGGFVRDILLGIENNDIDVTVEGDGILFAETFAGRYGCRFKSHRKFGTAVIIFPDGYKIDVASTRLEYYESPGALPTVERSSLRMDLYRRDFTINTLAIALGPRSFGLLLDFFGGQRDLHDKMIRVLHNLSFVEDPTRVFRAIRFEQRLGFHIARHTENLIKNAVKMNFLHKLGGKRLLTELVLILRDKEPLRAVERMASLGLLQFVHPDIRLTSSVRRTLEEAREVTSWYELLFLDRACEKWVVYFLSLSVQLSNDQFLETCVRLAVNEHYRQKLSEMRKRSEHVLSIMERQVGSSRPIQPSDIYVWLQALPMELLLYMMAKTSNSDARRLISSFVTTLQGTRCLISGYDLERLGVPKGPKFREILQAVLIARLNGRVTTKDEELGMVKDMLAQGL